jgi:acyl-CoA synthetase (AMP-forming)/AMP-acid ligase II
MVMQGYWRNPEASATALRDGWLHTGDAGRMLEDGHLFIVDRLKDMIITGGENVYCAEVEGRPAQPPAGGARAVSACPMRAGARPSTPVVVTTTDGSTSADELKAWCRERLAGYKCPAPDHLRARAAAVGGGQGAEERAARAGARVNPSPATTAATSSARCRSRHRLLGARTRILRGPAAPAWWSTPAEPGQRDRRRCTAA